MTASIPHLGIQVWDDAVTNVRRIREETDRPGRRLILAGGCFLAVVALALFAVSLRAQYNYIFAIKAEAWASYIEAGSLDAVMVVFSLLAMGLALAGQSATIERALIVLCSLGSAAMNYGAADSHSLRSVAAYVMPAILFAITVDRVIAVIKRHVLGKEDERSPWGAIIRAVLFVPRIIALIVLYFLRLILAPWSTITGARRWVLNSTPLPAAPAAVVLSAVPDDGADEERELEAPGRKALPPGSCIAELDSGEPCGRVRPCTRHEPEISLPDENKTQYMRRLYRGHPLFGDRSAVGPAAKELNRYVGTSDGNARNIIYAYLAELDAAQADEKGVA